MGVASKKTKPGAPSPERLAIFIVFVGLVAAVAYLFVRTDPVTVFATQQVSATQVDELIVEYRCGAAAVDLVLGRPATGDDLFLGSGVTLTSGQGACRDNALDRLPVAGIALLAAVVAAFALRRLYVWLAVAALLVVVLWGWGRIGTYPLLLGVMVAIALLIGLVWLFGGTRRR